MRDFKRYWNATVGVCNSAARWSECGGRGYEYYKWQCSYYKALNYVDYLYKKDGNFSISLDNCFEKYLSNLPEFKLAEEYCAKAKKLRKTAVDYSSGTLLKGIAWVGLLLMAFI